MLGALPQHDRHPGRSESALRQLLRTSDRVGHARGPERAPFVDVYETKDDLVLSVGVPGVSEKDISVMKATYRDGVLEIRLPKAEEVKPKEIKIDVL